MNINVSLIGQIITFLVFVWFVMKFVWPPIVEAMAEIESGRESTEEAVEETALPPLPGRDHIGILQGRLGG